MTNSGQMKTRTLGLARSRRLIIVAILACIATGASAKDHYVASPNAPKVRAPDGSPEAPWPTLHRALRDGDVKGGDRVLLGKGQHGKIYLPGLHFDAPVEILPQEPGTVFMTRLQIAGSSNLAFSGMKIWPEVAERQGDFLVSSKADTRDISFTDFELRGREDAPETYVNWTKGEWDRWFFNGFRLRGLRNSVINSRMTGIGFGIELMGDDSLAIGNHIEGFSRDGIRGLGDNSLYRNNHIENCVAVNSNHDDGFQSWAPYDDPAATRKVSGMVIEANTILEWTGPADHPLRCTLQGLGMFDGTYEDTIIRNNLVVVSAYHGISVYAGRNVQIVHNTVVRPSGSPSGHPWILLKDHKGGFPSSGNLIANNIAMAVTNQSSDKTAVPARTNFKTRYPMRYYRDILGGDFRLKPDSNIIGAANPAYAPETDIEGRPRPQGKGPDFGAYEMP